MVDIGSPSETAVPADGKREKQNSRRFIEAVGLCKSFNSSGARIDILKNASFDLEKGETLAIVGASGIGKSTLLHILGTLDRPDKGKGPDQCSGY